MIILFNSILPFILFDPIIVDLLTPFIYLLSFSRSLIILFLIISYQAFNYFYFDVFFIKIISAFRE